MKNRRPMLRPFHLAVAVHDLGLARRFYGDVLGCPEGRSSDTWVDFNLYGNQFVCHLDSRKLGPSKPSMQSLVDSEHVPVPHFGIVFIFEEWQQLADRLTGENVIFLIKPHVRFQNETGQQGTFFISDPSGNILEFKGFRDLDQLFARDD
jgi:extradiol dioxygenase family protein